MHGVHYWFVSEAEFDAVVEEDALLEWAVVHGSARYGTPADPRGGDARGGPAGAARDRPAGCPPGARADARRRSSVFLAPPSWDELVRRLVGRGTESEEERERRLATARLELAAEPEFDVVIVNREIHAAAEELVALMTGPLGPPTSDDL